MTESRMTTEERREQIARALCDKAYGAQAWDEFLDSARNYYRWLADAVLALPTPTAEAVNGEMLKTLSNAAIFLDVGANYAPNNIVDTKIESTGERLKTRGLAETMKAVAVECRAAIARASAPAGAGMDDVNDIRWAVNVLLEKIAAKFEANDTWDIWRSDAAALVRSFKHDLTAPAADGWQPIATAPQDREIILAGQYASGVWEVRSGTWLIKRWPFVGLKQPTHWCPLPAPPPVADEGTK